MSCNCPCCNGYQEGRCLYERADELRAELASETARADEAQLELSEVRKTLWMEHGHIGLYGDDGEMQCGKCAPYYDYRRQPIPFLISNVLRRINDKLVEAEARYAELLEKWRRDCAELLK